MLFFLMFSVRRSTLGVQRSFDVFVNDTTRWHNVSVPVRDYTIGGHQVINTGS